MRPTARSPRGLVASLLRSSDYSLGDVVRTLRGVSATQGALLSDLGGVTTDETYGSIAPWIGGQSPSLIGLLARRCRTDPTRGIGHPGSTAVRSRRGDHR